jgi:hypothetical protein
MRLQAHDSTQEAEILRLMALLPEEMRSQVFVEQTQSVKPDLVTTERIGRGKFSIVIDFAHWQRFPPDQRNLLFWHEVALIQGQSIHSSSWSAIVMWVGVVSLFAELLSQNLVGVVTTLVVMGLGGYQLYQQHWGERFLRGLTAADQGALQLASQFGYGATQAYDSLYGALKTLARNKSRKAYRKQSQVRLRVLEIVGSESHLLSSQTRPAFTADLPYQVFSLCS